MIIKLGLQTGKEETAAPESCNSFGADKMFCIRVSSALMFTLMCISEFYNDNTLDS